MLVFGSVGSMCFGSKADMHSAQTDVRFNVQLLFKQPLHRDGYCRVATVPDLVVEIRCKIVGGRTTKTRSLGVGS